VSTEGEVIEMASYLWRKYADYLYTKWEKTFLWDMVEPYRRPKSFTPLVTIYIAAFYSGVIGAAITEQLHKVLLLLLLLSLFIFIFNSVIFNMLCVLFLLFVLPLICSF